MIARIQSRLSSTLGSILGRRRLEEDMEEEVRFHIDARAAELKRNGLSPEEAKRRARLEFGDMATHKDDMRSSLGLRWIDDLWCDLRYAARILRKSPGFTAIAVGSLALAIGANTTIFSIANEMLYERLAVPHPEQLRLFTLTGDRNVVVHSSWGNWDRLPGGRISFSSFTYPIYQQLRKDNRVLQDIFAFKDIGRINVTVNGDAQAVQLELVSGNFYEQMQVVPVLGRAIIPSDDATPGSGAVAVISDGFWERNFGRSPDVIGKVISVNSIPVTIVGVNPRGFTGAKSVQSSPALFMPLSMISSLHAEFHGGPFLSNARVFWVQLMARTKPEIPVAQAQVALNLAVNAAIRATMTIKKDDTMPELTLDDGSRGLNFAFTAREFAKPVYVLLGFVGFVLLLACANIANLMLARASVRQREMSVRLALGAGSSRILRQVLTESLMISVMGGVLGTALYFMSRSSLPKLFINAWERPDLVLPFHWRVYAFTAAVTILTGILFGLAPAWSSTKAEIGTALKEGGKTATRHRKGWSGKAIVAFQLALSTMLVVGSALFIRTLINLNSIDPGFRTDHLLLFDINPPSKRYPEPKDIALHTQLEAALRAVPGVQSVTLTDNPLVANEMSNSDFIIEGAPKVERKREDNSGSANLADVGYDFLSVMGIPVVAGRGFTPQDVNSPQRVAVVNQTLVRHFFPHDNPIGKRFSLDDRPEQQRWIQIVGVVGDTRYSNLKDESPAVHFDLFNQLHSMGGATYTIRTQMPPEAITPSLRDAVQKIDRDLPLMDIRTQQQQIDATTQQERVFASLTAGFGILALALACVGIYGIMAYTVSQRTNEIGIRLALGAERSQVRTMILREASRLTILGIAAGLLTAFGLARLVQSMLYGLKASDPASFTAAGSLLLAIALFAAWVPALRASRVEPMEALRHE